MKTNIYQQSLRIVFFLTFIFLVFVMVFNYYVDPGNRFSNAHTFEAKIMHSLLGNHDVMIGLNYNDRSMQKLMLNNLATRPALLILGSSHSMPIHQTYFQNLTIYNASVPSATLEDDLAFYYLYRQRGWQPDIVIICLDPWIVDAEFTQFKMLKSWKGQWQTILASEYHHAVKLISGNKITTTAYTEALGHFENYLQLLSFDYLFASFKQMTLKHTDKVITPSNHALCPECKINLPDGARIPSQNEELLSTEVVEETSLKQLQNLQEAFASYHGVGKLDSPYAVLFETFIAYLVKQNIKVIFYFPPIEPKVYRALMKEEKDAVKVKIAEQYFSSLATRYHLKMISSYDPYKQGLQTSDFVDSWHLKEKGTRHIFKLHPIVFQKIILANTYL